MESWLTIGKQLIVKALFKKGSREFPSNYRPIYLTLKKFQRKKTLGTPGFEPRTAA